MNSLASRLSKCSSSQLKAFAELVGINTTATKALLIENLQSELLKKPYITTLTSASRRRERPIRILSIDMGIRNLAFCVLEVQGNEKSNSKSTTNSKSPQGSDLEIDVEAMPSVLDSVKLIAWKRTSLYDILESGEEARAPDSMTIPASVGEIDEQEDDSSSPSSTSVASHSTKLPPKEAFDPATFASLTYKLVTRVFLGYDISHVLIERQRYRSGSAPAIMEWTVRVNMLESMLHAVFGTLRSEGFRVNDADNSTILTRTEKVNESNFDQEEAKSWSQGIETDVTSRRWNVLLPTVHSISPRRVGSFWDKTVSLNAIGSSDNTAPSGPAADSTEVSATVKKSSRARIEKEVKIAIAERFLTNGAPGTLAYSEEAEETRQAFLTVRNRKNDRSIGRRKADTSTIKNGTRPNSKLDDLADCLLQGAAWAQWDLNRVLLYRRLSQMGDEPVEKYTERTGSKKVARRRGRSSKIGSEATVA